MKSILIFLKAVTKMEERLARQISLIGEEKTEKLKNASVMIFGMGGVGGYALEAVARTGVGKITVVDGDVFAESNRNRQLLCDVKNIGKTKAGIAGERLRRIAPECDVTVRYLFANEDNIPVIVSAAKPDMIIDAIDSVKSKLALIRYCTERNISIVSCMGTGNKLDMTKLKIGDISKTSVCPLAKAIRVGLREMGISHLPVVWSDEIPVQTGSATPSSISYVPAAAGLLLAQYAIGKIIGE